MSASDSTPSQLQNLFEHSLDMLAIGQNRQLIDVNPAWTTVLDWSPEELTSTKLETFVHPDDVEATQGQLRLLEEGISSNEFRNRMRHRDGSYRTLRWSMHLQDDVAYFGARDVTNYVTMRERAERSEAIGLAVLRTAVDPIIVIDTFGTMISANESTTRLFGYSTDQLLGRNVSMLMPEPYRSEHDGYLSRYLGEGDPRIIGIGREVPAQKSDGTIFPMALAVSEAITERDHLFTGIIHDLTERNRQRDDLQDANTHLEARVSERTERLEELLDEVRRSNRDLEQFAYIASHDLQAPLRNVRQGLELLDEHLQETAGTRFDEEANELRDLVVAAVIRMEQLIKGLLTYSRVQRYPRDDRHPVDLTVVATDVADTLRIEIEAVGGQIVVNQLPTIQGNDVQLRQVFQNLIENAIRYRSVHRDLHIAIGARDPAANKVIVTCTDNGSGIEEAHHERIFELFRRGHSGYDGVGLGLAICQRIVEGHGGRIWVESTADNGATFCLELPSRDQ